MASHRDNKSFFVPNILGKGLARQGHTVHVITTGRDDGVTEQEISEGFTVHYLADTPTGQYTEAFWEESAAKYMELRTETPFDVVLSGSEASFGWYKHVDDNIPLIHIKHNSYTKVKRRFRPSLDFDTLRSVKNILYQRRFLRDVGKPLMKRADSIVCVSEANEANVHQDYGEKIDKTEVIYNGIDVDLFENIDPTRVTEIDEQFELTSEYVLLFVGRIYELKGLRYLLEAIPALEHDVDVLIVGKTVSKSDEKYLERLQGRAESLGITDSVHFVGGVPHPEIPKYYHRADLLVLPSISESYGMVLLESLATETPAVGTRIGGIPEAIRDGKDGIVVEPRNSNALAGAISRLLENDSLRSSLGKNGHERVSSDFTIDRMVAEYETLIRSVSE